jgi:putative methanogenesis marker protein 8
MFREAPTRKMKINAVRIAKERQKPVLTLMGRMEKNERSNTVWNTPIIITAIPLNRSISQYRDEGRRLDVIGIFTTLKIVRHNTYVQMDKKDKHVLEAIGRARIVVRNGKVVEVGPPLLNTCPLARRFARPVEKMEPEAIRENMEERIRGYGMCTPARALLSDQDFVLFGASELIACGIRRGLLDAAVIVCDGAGTIVTSDPRLIQGIGGRMSGMVCTTPIREVMKGIEAYGGHILSSTAEIDQVSGTARAYALGFRNVAVTVADAMTAQRIRTDFPETLLFGVHLTGVSRDEAERLIRTCDLVSACASAEIRSLAGSSALLQAGGSVPVFAFSVAGKELVLEKLRDTRSPLFVKAGTLPVQMGEQPEPLI